MPNTSKWSNEGRIPTTDGPWTKLGYDRYFCLPLTSRVSNDKVWLRRRRCKSLCVNGLVGRDWQTVQKMMSVFACCRTLVLTDSKRMFIRIITWVFPPATYLHGLVIDRDWLRGRRCKSPHVNRLIGRDWLRVQKTTLVSACYHALSQMDSKRMFKRITTGVFPPAP